MSTLEKRCAQMHARIVAGAPVDELVGFVIAEMGRSTESEYKDALPLCLYFPDAEARQRFIEVTQMLTGIRTRKLP